MDATGQNDYTGLSMRRLAAILTISLSVLFLCSTILVVTYSLDGRSILSRAGMGSASLADHHVIALLPDGNTAFTADLRNGILDTAAQRNIALEIRYLPPASDLQGARHALEAALLSRPDGVLVCGRPVPEWIALVNRGVESGVPVITMVSDVAGSKRQAFVGANDYSLGKVAARLVFDSRPASARVGLVISPDGITSPQASGNLVQAGFNEVARSGPDHRIIAIIQTDQSILGGEAATRQLLVANPDIDTLVCLSARDTIGAVQALVDMNRLGNVAIIGSDDTPVIREMIQKKVISAAIARRPRQMGSQAMEALLSVILGGTPSSFIEHGVMVLRLSEDGRGIQETSP